ncbi:MAG TPA: YbaN family protein [Allosphingosinicella sp.]|nr:YbaN family protein [Allosphingosinicella sp.]
MLRIGYLIVGMLALLLAGVGAFVPLLPTVPFVILAAFCFARSSPRLEAWLLTHRTFGPHLAAWRSRGAISRTGKRAAIIAFAISAAAGFALLSLPWSLVPASAALIGGSWILSRPSA